MEMKNGLNKTVAGQSETRNQSSTTRNKSNSVTVLKDCYIKKIKGCATWEDFSYNQMDSGGILIDVTLPLGVFVEGPNGTMTNIIKNVRLRTQSYQDIMNRGLFTEDFVGTTCDLTTPFLTYSGVQSFGEITFSTESKETSNRNKTNNDIMSLTHDKIVPGFSFVMGAGKSNASKMLKEMFLYEKYKGELG